MTRGREGLTIVETLIAIAVIGVVFVVLAAIQVSNLGVTRAAREDSQLLQDAVTEFEGLRTAVLQDFRAYFEGCPEGCVLAPSGDTQLHEFPYAITRVWAPDDDSGSLVGDDPGGGVDPVDGLVRVTILAERDGRTILFGQYVSCLDSTMTPTISDASECRDEVD
jgi:type II secretory pathway pseudopilin PulG